MNAFAGFFTVLLLLLWLLGDPPFSISCCFHNFRGRINHRLDCSEEFNRHAACGLAAGRGFHSVPIADQFPHLKAIVKWMWCVCGERDATFCPTAKKPRSAVTCLMIPFASSASIFWSPRPLTNPCVNKGVEKRSTNASFCAKGGVSTNSTELVLWSDNKIFMGRMTTQARNVTRMRVPCRGGEGGWLREG